MPKTPFINAVTDLTAIPFCNESDLAEKLSRIFQVSPSSASIRLSQLEFTRYAGKNASIHDERQLNVFRQMPGTL